MGKMGIIIDWFEDLLSASVGSFHGQRSDMSACIHGMYMFRYLCMCASTEYRCKVCDLRKGWSFVRNRVKCSVDRYISTYTHILRTGADPSKLFPETGIDDGDVTILEIPWSENLLITSAPTALAPSHSRDSLRSCRVCRGPCAPFATDVCNLYVSTTPRIDKVVRDGEPRRGMYM